MHDVEMVLVVRNTSLLPSGAVRVHCTSGNDSVQFVVAQQSAHLYVAGGEVAVTVRPAELKEAT